MSADCNEILLSDDDDVGAGKDGAGSLSKVERKAAKRRLKEVGDDCVPCALAPWLGSRDLDWSDLGPM